MAFQHITYLARSPEGEIHTKYSQRTISDVEVVIRVTRSELCGTYTHDLKSGCGLGREGVGIVEKFGVEVTAVKTGWRVGWGYSSQANGHKSCSHCREYLDGYRHYCPESVGQRYGELDQGAFGDFVVKHQDFIFSIPDLIESKYAGLLNCAGTSLLLQISSIN
ncbi:chaperonin 10-like protein [Bisporella sp. PMI_857]|nr:chaperonin 10-like protein [Bisporella sp. PMI_857]